MTEKSVLVKLPNNWEERPQPPGKMLFRSGDGRYTIYVRRPFESESYEVESARHKPVENPDKSLSDTGMTVVNDSVKRWHNTASWGEAVKTVIGFMRQNP